MKAKKKKLAERKRQLGTLPNWENSPPNKAVKAKSPKVKVEVKEIYSGEANMKLDSHRFSKTDNTVVLLCIASWPNNNLFFVAKLFQIVLVKEVSLIISGI